MFEDTKNIEDDKKEPIIQDEELQDLFIWFNIYSIK